MAPARYPAYVVCMMYGAAPDSMAAAGLSKILLSAQAKLLSGNILYGVFEWARRGPAAPSSGPAQGIKLPPNR